MIDMMTTPKEESASQLLHPASSEAADDDSSVMSCEKGTGDQLGPICFYLDCFERKTPILSHITNTTNHPVRKDIISGECNNVMMTVMVMVVGPIKNHCQNYTQVITSEGRKWCSKALSKTFERCSVICQWSLTQLPVWRRHKEPFCPIRELLYPRIDSNLVNKTFPADQYSWQGQGWEGVYPELGAMTVCPAPFMY